MAKVTKPIVFISNTWVNHQKDDGSWERGIDERAIDVADRLRQSGFDVRLDWYFMKSFHGFNPPDVVNGDPRNPWTIWQETQIREADCVLLLCVPEYLDTDPDKCACPGLWCDWHDFSDDDRLMIDKGLAPYRDMRRIPGLWYDWHFMKLELETGVSPRGKFIPVGFGSYNPDFVPMFIRGATYYNLDSNADYEGLTRRIESIHRQRNPRRGVFISYAHSDDSVWLDSLLRHLEPLKEHQIEVWTDREIKPGARWHDEIQNSLWRAKVAILMVSPAFLASAYIANNELPPLLRAASSEGLTIFWIPVMSSNYEQSEINQYQAAHPPSKPLSTLNAEECDEAFAAITSKLIEALGL